MSHDNRPVISVRRVTTSRTARYTSPASRAGQTQHDPTNRQWAWASLITPFGQHPGRVTASQWDPAADPAKMEVLCTNPANLAAGGSGNLISRNSTAGFPGIIGIGIGLLGNRLPAGLTTPWVSQSHLYSARCEKSNGANVLMVRSRTVATPLNPSPDATWGLHLADMNIAGGNLVSLAKSQASAWRP